ncbi:T-complex protein 11-domain-containing protein [Aspergillus granulosus]|uniref:T-complex protein 11-domain-containing protein n=1 Tax=Aspergillus granulosus TaxID=176169 RepID=A0ABR4H3H6_9EURO
MDFQKTKEAHHTTGKNDEGTECPLEPYKGNSHSKNSPKNDSLGHRPETNKANESASGGHRSQNGEPYTQESDQASTRLSTAPTLATVHSELFLPSSKAIDIPPSLRLSPEEARLLKSANMHPPVTKSTLSELDLPCIMSNINLRVDANFDRDLHFKPDSDGEKGRKKRKDAAEYWDAMAVEIGIYSFCASCGANNNAQPGPRDKRRTFEPRLPALFETLQDVLKTLVPERDHPSIMQNLEVALLMQQIQKGVLDMVGVAKWLAALLKTHCAPMRDEWADSMVEQITSGSQSQNPTEIVRGLHTLFGILEAMKLDVANHQIRAFRVLLVEDTIPFLQDYFRSKIDGGNFRVESSRLWYQSLREQELRRMEVPTQMDGFWPLSLLLQGLSELLLQFDNPDGFPETFIFDSDRLWDLRISLQSAINLEICCHVLESYMHSKKRHIPAPEQTYATFRSRVATLMKENEDCARRSPRWLKNVRSIALEIARFASMACCGEVLVEDHLIEQLLEYHLSNEAHLFRACQSVVREKLLHATLGLAKRYLNMSPLAICEAQPHPAHRPIEQRYGIERDAMRLAHIAVLHWRVWAPILYVRESMPPTDEPKTGLPSSGTKPVLVAGLESGLAPYCSPLQRRSREQNGKTGEEKGKGDRVKELSILSIDMGIRNLAFAHLRCNSSTILPSSSSSSLLSGSDDVTKGENQNKVVLDAWRRISLPFSRAFTVEELERYLDAPPGTAQTQSWAGSESELASTSDSEAEASTAEQNKTKTTSKEKEKESFSLPIYAEHAHNIISILLTRYQPTHILIERQRFRSGGGASVQEWSLRVGVFEGMFWAVLGSLRAQTQAQLGVQGVSRRDGGDGEGERSGHTWPMVISIEPGRVGRYWMPPGASTEDITEAATGVKPKKRVSNREGKKTKIDLVGSWLERGSFALGDDGVEPWVKGYMSKWKKMKPVKTKSKSKLKKGAGTAGDGDDDSGRGGGIADIGKLDDLADCVVQGVTWLEWEGMRRRVVRDGVDAAGLDLP